MKKFVLIFGALAALFSSSACNYSSHTAAEYSASVNIGSTDGLVWPSAVRPGCMPDSKAPPNPPLPKKVPHATWYNTGTPPVRYQKDVKVTIYFENPDLINKEAGYHNKPYCDSTVFAYTITENKEMHIPNPCDYPQTDAYARLVCHEMGHVNGWPGYHGD